MATADDDTGESDGGETSSGDAFLRDVARIDDHTSARAATRAIGSRVGRFVLRGVLGRGGMGVVYRAHDPVLGRSVALKLLPAQREGDPQLRARFLREARSSASIVHPNVATIYEVGEAEVSLFIAMELVPGESLRARFTAGRPLPVDDVIALATRIARGLSAAHAQGIVHRDLKPENVMVDGGEQVKILDFGLAKLRDTGEAPREILEHQATDAVPTAEGQLLGTPAYMSPEQAAGKPVDPRSDLFALGVVLYEALTGGRPFVGETSFETLASVMRDSPPDIRGVNPDVPDDLAALVTRCLAKAPDGRPASASELVTLLEALGGRVNTPTTAAVAAMKRPRGSSAPVIALLVGLAVAAGIGGQWRRAKTVAAPIPLGAVASAEVLRPMQLTDFPPPKTTSAAALAQYQNAWRDIYDATRSPGQALEEAEKLDPTFAAMHLRSAFVSGRPFSAHAYRDAVRYRDKLDERDRALLLAYEPCELPVMPDLLECERRFAALHRDRPTDVEVLRQLGVIQSKRDPLLALPTFEELARLDPRMAAAELAIATRLARMGKLEEANRHFARCSELSPTAGSCILSQGYIGSRGGHCEILDQAVRRVMVFDSQSQVTHIEQLNALLSIDAPRPILDAKLAAFLDLLEPPERAFWRGEVALWFGDMTTTYTTFGDEKARHTREDPSVLYGFYQQLVAAEELGDERSVQALLRAYAAERGTKSTEGREDVHLRAMREHRTFPAAEIATLRERWRQESRTNGEMTEWLRWLAFDGAWAISEEEARAALAMDVAKEVPPGLAADVFNKTDVQAELGRLLLMAGRPADAVAYLESAALACRPFLGFVSESNTPFIMGAGYDLGRAREALGQSAAACDAYARVMRRWGSGNPLPVTAKKARARMTALACP